MLISAGCGNDGGANEGAETGEPEDYGPVRGDLEITDVQVSQSVATFIYREGEVVSPVEFGVPLVPNRHMWVQALWDPPLEWTPRPLTAHLLLEFPDGSEKLIEDRESASGAPPVVQGKSSPTDLQTGFYWRVDAEDVVPGLRYSITVVEVEPPGDIPESTGDTQWPRANNTSIPVREFESELNLALVGIRYNASGCSSDTSTSLTDADIEAIRAGFEAWNGVGSNAVNIDRGLTLDVDTPLQVVDLLMLGGMVRAEYPDLTNTFFYFVFDDCTPAPNGILGIAPVNPVPPSPGDVLTRYGVGLWHASDVGESVNTAIHEIGHSQGSAHAPCGGAGSPDPEYPHANASIGAWGLDLLTAVFYDPASYADYMSYCRPYWVSDFQFTRTYEVQSTMTAWGSPGGLDPHAHTPGLAPAQPASQLPAGYTGEVLTGVVRASGETRWWVFDSPRPPRASRDAELRVVLGTAAGPREVAVDVRPLPDLGEDARLVTIPLVDGVGRSDISSIEVHGALERSVAGPEILDARAHVRAIRRGK